MIVSPRGGTEGPIRREIYVPDPAEWPIWSPPFFPAPAPVPEPAPSEPTPAKKEVPA